MENIIENNKLIAEFMELGIQLNLAEHPETGEYTSLDEFNYHDSWDWLMPVVEKIEGLDNTTAVFETDNLIIITTLISRNPYKVKQQTSLGNQSSKIEAVYNTVVEFIKWYNEQK